MQRPTPQVSQQKLNSYSDEALLRLVAQHHLAAYALLYQRHAQLLFNLLVRIVGHATTAETLLQDVFWQIWQSASQLPDGEKGTIWMIHMARQCGLAQLRRHGGRSPVCRQQTTQLAEGQALPEQQCPSLELAFFEGLSITEIAQHTCREARTVHESIRNGLEQLEDHRLSKLLLPQAVKNSS